MATGDSHGLPAKPAGSPHHKLITSHDDHEEPVLVSRIREAAAESCDSTAALPTGGVRRPREWTLNPVANTQKTRPRRIDT